MLDLDGIPEPGDSLASGTSPVTKLDPKVVADELHAIGCDFVQGYAYDMPLRLQDIMVAFDPLADRP